MTFSLLTKISIIIFLVFSFGPVRGEGANVIQCLGQEEGRIFKEKITGPIYQLNQKLLNLWISGDVPPIKENYLQKICSAKAFSPSLNLLKYLLIYNKNIFLQEDEHPKKKQIIMGQIANILRKIPGLFIDYVTSLEAVIGISDCLPKEIPDLRKYFQEYNYLEGEKGQFKYLFDKKKLSIIFEKLSPMNLNLLIKKCKQDLKIKKTARKR